jgi:hypothetical protein
MSFIFQSVQGPCGQAWSTSLSSLVLALPSWYHLAIVSKRWIRTVWRIAKFNLSPWWTRWPSPLLPSIPHHIHIFKHVFDAPSGKGGGGTGICGRQWRRFAVSTRAVIGNQPSMHKWFHSTQSSSQYYGGSVQTGQVHSTLIFFWWGYWESTTSYNNKVYDVKKLLSDPHKGINWHCGLYRFCGQCYN